MEYHSFVDSEGNYLGKTKYTKGEFIPLPPEGVNEDIRFVNNKWVCTLPKVDNAEEGYIKFNLNLDKLDKLNDTLLQLEVFCKKNKIESEFIIKEIQFSKFTTEQQKQIIKSIINYGFKDIVFIDNKPLQVKCKNYFTYNYNTKKREYNKIYFRKNVNYSFDDNANVIVSKGVDYNLLNDCLYNIKKKHDNFPIGITFVFQYIGCNAKCWYCTQKQSQRFPELTTNDKNLMPSFKKALNRVEELSKKENVKINFTFLGGELTILDYDIQDEFAKIINELVEKEYGVNFFSNGILKDAPLLHTKANYLIHVIDWKNKKLEKKKNTKYIIVFTERDSVEDLEKFKKLNKDVPIDIILNSLANQDFFEKKHNKKTDYNYVYEERDKKHKMYLCKYNYREVAVDFENSKHYNYIGCCSNKKISENEIPTLLTTNIKCPKTCVACYCKP